MKEQNFNEQRLKKFKDGSIAKVEFLLHGELHRTDGPAEIVYARGGGVSSESYHINGKRHRPDGPAFIHYYPDGSISCQEYFLNGEPVSNPEPEKPKSTEEIMKDLAEMGKEEFTKLYEQAKKLPLTELLEELHGKIDKDIKKVIRPIVKKSMERKLKKFKNNLKNISKEDILNEFNKTKMSEEIASSFDQIAQMIMGTIQTPTEEPTARSQPQEESEKAVVDDLDPWAMEVSCRANLAYTSLWNNYTKDYKSLEDLLNKDPSLTLEQRRGLLKLFNSMVWRKQ